MRLISYSLSFLAIFLILNIVLSFSFVWYRDFLKNVKNQINGVETSTKEGNLRNKNDEVNERLLNTIEELSQNIEKISTKNENSTWSNVSNETNSGKTVENLWLPNSLTFKILPQFNPLKVENNWFYDIKSTDVVNLKYSSYFDEKKNMKIYVFEKGYGDIMTIIRKYSKYKINEKNNFFGYSFYLNPIFKDDKVRFIVQLEAKSVWFEINNSNYNDLKILLLK
ncbi:MAG: hypothetical protein ACD_49C00059G0007 [uncultured bacterium (gcode 4)]|uniref:Uncharacterized protein n=1 Tax=uncultured bacterium (gcode 4) TaxID=1234023 RepID=K2BVI4_9BACT|nr:MAG: hypothetical protein ACD_49C00059G0007 [uncultured bacterium (gcode 4)]